MQDYPLIEHLGDYAQAIAARFPQRPALTAYGRHCDYGALAQRVQQVANGLVEAGLQAGDRVAYVGRNSDCYIEILLGAARAGLVIAPLNWRLVSRELAEITADLEPAMIFYETEFTRLLENSLSGLPSDRVIVVSPTAENCAYQQWRREQCADVVPAVPRDSHDCVLQLYTSGTTGRPKGVRLSHGAVAAHRTMEDGFGDHSRWDDNEVILVTSPVFHVAGTMWALQGLHRGAHLVLPETVEPEALLDAVAEFHVSKMFAAPVLINWFVQRLQARPRDISSLKLMLYGASPIPAAVLRAAMEIMPNVGFQHLYGMTEAGGTVVQMAPDEHDPVNPDRLKSCGRPGKGIEICIVDEAGNALSTGKVGEVSIKGPVLMNGYWQKPDETAAVLQDGWYYSGDAGYLDEEGFLYIVDRVKDMIITGGENVYPAEVENVLYEHNDVAMAAVIGLPDPDWGEAVTAVVQRKENATITESDMRKFLRGRIAGYKVPKLIEFVEAMPLTPSNKIRKHILKERFATEVT